MEINITNGSQTLITLNGRLDSIMYICTSKSINKHQQ